MSDKISMAIIGGGRTGTPLLKELLKYPYIEIAGVADLDPKAEGVKIAAANGIFTTSDPMELVMKGGAIDILVEVSGDNKLKRTIKSEFERSGNTRTIIMHDLIARLFISVCTQQQQLIPSMHPQDVGVGS
jgi:acetaldehyde dehydrogenase (acetylating)